MGHGLQIGLSETVQSVTVRGAFATQSTVESSIDHLATKASSTVRAAKVSLLANFYESVAAMSPPPTFDYPHGPECGNARNSKKPKSNSIGDRESKLREMQCMRQQLWYPSQNVCAAGPFISFALCSPYSKPCIYKRTA